MKSPMGLYDLPFYNASGETAPPFAVMQVDNWKDDVNDRDYFRIKKPDGTGKFYIINGPIAVAASGDGMASLAHGIQASYYPGDGTPANGETWGPEAGIWLLRKDKPGFTIIGDSEVIGGIYTIRVTVANEAAENPLIYFELVQDKSYADYAKLALPVNSSNVRVGDAVDDSFYVLDDQRQFYGKAAADGAEGYRGVGLKLFDAYTPGGEAPERPAYRIITMEGPAHWMIVVLEEDYQSSGGTEATPTENEIWGRPFRNRGVSGEDTVQVFDDEGVAEHAKDGQKWEIAFDEVDEHWIFVKQLLEYHVIKGTATVTRSMSTFTLTSPVSVQGPVPTGSITVTNDPKCETNGSKTVYARYDVTKHATAENQRWSTADAGNFVWHLQGLADWDAGKVQIIEQYNGDEPHWADSGDCEEA